MILTCPDCGGFDDRPYELCGMCSDPGVSEAWCPHERLERFNAGCECIAACHLCDAELDNEADECWSCGA